MSDEIRCGAVKATCIAALNASLAQFHGEYLSEFQVLAGPESTHPHRERISIQGRASSGWRICAECDVFRKELRLRGQFPIEKAYVLILNRYRDIFTRVEITFTEKTGQMVLQALDEQAYWAVIAA